MNFIKKSILLFGLFFMGYSSTFGLVLQVPPAQGQEDIIITGPTQIQTDESTLFEVIQIINKYLWFSIGAIAMIIFITAGFKLITAQGDSAVVGKSNKMLVGSMIALVVAMSSYAIVRILVNLF